MGKFYSDFEREAFDWLTDESEGARKLVNDVTDTLRALRCGDVFRQRGTVEKTSGGYEIYASQKTGNCIVALRLGGNRLYLLELPNNLDGAGTLPIRFRFDDLQPAFVGGIKLGYFFNKRYLVAGGTIAFQLEYLTGFWLTTVPLPNATSY